MLNIPPLRARAAAAARAGARLQHVHPVRRRSARDRAVRRRDRARAARGGGARARATRTVPGRSAAPTALALRADGHRLRRGPDRVTAIEPGDKAYKKVRSTYIRSGSPGLVLQPRDAGEVAEALAFAREQDVPLAVRSGGHGISGRSTNDGGIVIDVGRLNAIACSTATASGSARARAGATSPQALAPHGLGDELGRLRRRRRRRARDRGRHRIPGPQARADDRPRDRRRARARRRHASCARTTTSCGRSAARAATSASSPRSSSRPYPVGDVVFSTMAFERERDAAGALGRGDRSRAARADELPHASPAGPRTCTRSTPATTPRPRSRR